MPTVSNNTLMGLTRVQSGAEHAGADAPPPPPPPAPAIRAPLHAAAVEGDVARVRYLLGLTEKKGLAVKIDGVDEVGRTALHVAAELGRRDVCEVLPRVSCRVPPRLHNRIHPLHSPPSANPRILPNPLSPRPAGAAGPGAGDRVRQGGRAAGLHCAPLRALGHPDQRRHGGRALTWLWLSLFGLARLVSQSMST